MNGRKQPEAMSFEGLVRALQRQGSLDEEQARDLIRFNNTESQKKQATQRLLLTATETLAMINEQLAKLTLLTERMPGLAEELAKLEFTTAPQWGSNRIRNLLLELGLVTEW